MAMLAAFDIQQAFGFRSLRVYTYGAPRVGNHIFASEYNDAVPNTWTVINDKVCLAQHIATHCVCQAGLSVASTALLYGVCMATIG